MPLFRAPGACNGGKAGQRRWKRMKWKGSKRKRDEDDNALPSLTELCLFSLADNMKEVWVKDYADKYLDRYSFRHIMGPFNLLPGDLVEELTCLLSKRKQLSRAALHLLLVPQLHNLSLERCPGLVTSAMCTHIAARCQGLWSLDLSGAQQLPSKVLSATLCCLPELRSLSLAGTPCDRCVIRTITHHCPLLRHLDVSRCHFLSPASLLVLVGGPFCSSSSGSSFCSTSTSQPPVASSSSSSSSFASPSPVPLTSLLALDIGFGEQEKDPAAAAAYLLLSLPGLKTLAMEGLAQACRLIEHREFSQTDEFSIREGVPKLMEVWSERRHRQDKDRWMEKRGAAAAAAAAGNEEHEEEEMLWEGYCEDSDEDVSGDEGPSCSRSKVEEKRKGRVSSQSGDEQLILQLKDVKGVTYEFLDSLGHLCPHICSIAVDVSDNKYTAARNQGSVLAAGLQTWSGQLQSLSLLHAGLLDDLSPALQVTGSSLVSLTLQGMRTRPQCPLLEIIKACPRLRELLIFAERPLEFPGFPAIPEEDVVAERDDRDLPQLPNLCSLTINFSHSDSQKRPPMSWLSLGKVLRCLLRGSPLLERVSLVALPCPLNYILQHLLHIRMYNLHRFGGIADLYPMALRRVKHIDLTRTDVKMTTVRFLKQRSRRLEFVDLSHCWEISQADVSKSKIFSDVKVVWV
ncbi:uncharacterized protein LOC131463412 [Solea solea]|uniref:uncharacterized protein LOC131463412 n=1 Tax=Solea solea TaxID=90069 RepID=UPI00272DA50E|nr:uncharacterized protein LOC131463412 [Solea solea]